jgi:hypothetical protein
MVGLERGAASRVPAVLVYDTAAQPLRQGVRAVTQRARRLLFMAEDTELMLQLAPTSIPTCLKLVGQVLDCGEPVSGVAVELRGPAGAIAQTTDDDGHFSIDELPKGAYAIAVDASHQSISVADLALN